MKNKKNRRPLVWWIDGQLRLRYTFMPTKKTTYGIFINKRDAEFHAACVRDAAYTVHHRL